MDCSPPGSSVRGILQARMLEWAAAPSSRGSSRPGDGTLVSCVSCLGSGLFTASATQGRGTISCLSSTLKVQRKAPATAVTLDSRGPMGPRRGPSWMPVSTPESPPAQQRKPLPRALDPKLPEGKHGIQPFTQTRTQGRRLPLRDPVTRPWACGGPRRHGTCPSWPVNGRVWT